MWCKYKDIELENNKYRNTSLIRHQKRVPYKWNASVNISGYSYLSNKCFNLMIGHKDWENLKPVPICRNGKAFKLGAWCLIISESETCFIFERGDSPYRLVPYRWGITVITNYV